MKRSFSLLLLIGLAGCGSQADDSAAIKEHEAIQQQFKAADAERSKAAKEITFLRAQISNQERAIDSLSREIESVRRENGRLGARITGLSEQSDRQLNELRKAAVTPKPASDSLPANAVTRAQFTKSLIENRGNFRIRSSTPEQVVRLYGKPDKTWTTSGTTYWQYNHRTYDPATKKLDTEAEIEFDGDDNSGIEGVRVIRYR
jgi:seryl-tRNA synthetase